jgi:hypothetical protein
VGISWTQFEESVPIDITGFSWTKCAGTRVRVVDFATPKTPTPCKPCGATIETLEETIFRSSRDKEGVDEKGIEAEAFCQIESNQTKTRPEKAKKQ